jgi:predicted nucleic acid-binding protein
MSDSAKTPPLLDSFALLAFLNREQGFATVRDLLRSAREVNEPLLMNEINIGEVYYIIAKGRSLEQAEEFLHRFETLPIQRLGNTFHEVLEAAKIKAQFPISYADAFMVATAQRARSTVVTGDPEFRSVAHLIDIVWL